MKLTKFFLVAAIAGTTALLAGSARAVPEKITVSATVRVQQSNVSAGTADVSQTSPMVWNTPKVYSLISSAVASAGTNGTGIALTNLPSDGYIAFDPSGYDGNVYGTFYVTNGSGFSYPLSGVDTNGNYYSFIEFDTYLGTTDNTATNTTTTNIVTSTNNTGTNVTTTNISSTNSIAGLVNFGFSDNFNGIETGRFTGNGGGGESVVSTALFYVHDDPYSYNGGNNPNAFYGNNNAFEIRGLSDLTITYKAGSVAHWTISLQGNGNAVVNSSQNAVVISGHFSVSQ